MMPLPHRFGTWREKATATVWAMILWTEEDERVLGDHEGCVAQCAYANPIRKLSGVKKSIGSWWQDM
jgi:hypothetical protein